MSEFRLELLADDKTSIVASKKTVMQQADEFKQDYISRHPEYKEILSLKSYGETYNLPNEMKSMATFFNDLDVARFWGTIEFVDGRLPNQNSSASLFEPTSVKDTLKKNIENREKAKTLFSHDDLEKILNIAVNQALLVPKETSMPGTYIGHSILFDELVEKKDSIFNGVVDENFRKRLNNGRFWKLLPDMSTGLNHGYGYAVVDDVLVNYPGDFDAAFFPKKGFEIFYRNRGERMHFDLSHLRDKAVDKYFKFVNDIHLNMSDDESFKHTQHLLKPLILELIQFYDSDYNKEELRFKGNKDKCKAMLKSKIIQDCLKKSELAGKAVAEHFETHIAYGHDQDRNETISYMGLIPNPTDFLEKLLNVNHGSTSFHNRRDIAKFVYECGKSGVDLGMFFDYNYKKKVAVKS